MANNNNQYKQNKQTKQNYNRNKNNDSLKLNKITMEKSTKNNGVVVRDVTESEELEKSTKNNGVVVRDVTESEEKDNIKVTDVTENSAPVSVSESPKAIDDETLEEPIYTEPDEPEEKNQSENISSDNEQDRTDTLNYNESDENEISDVNEFNEEETIDDDFDIDAALEKIESATIVPEVHSKVTSSKSFILAACVNGSPLQMAKIFKRCKELGIAYEVENDNNIILGTFNSREAAIKQKKEMNKIGLKPRII